MHHSRILNRRSFVVELSFATLCSVGHFQVRHFLNIIVGTVTLGLFNFFYQAFFYELVGFFGDTYFYHEFLAENFLSQNFCILDFMNSDFNCLFLCIT